MTNTANATTIKTIDINAPVKSDYEKYTEKRNAEQSALKDLLEKANENILPEYRNSDTPAEALGTIVSQYIMEQHGNGEDCAKFMFAMLSSALEDHNWHTEAQVIYEWRGKMSKGTELKDILPQPEQKYEVYNHETKTVVSLPLDRKTAIEMSNGMSGFGFRAVTS